MRKPSARQGTHRLLVALLLAAAPIAVYSDPPAHLQHVGGGRIDLGMISTQPLPSKYANTRLVKLGDADANGKDDIVFLDGPRSGGWGGYTGRVVAYAWAGTDLKRLLPRAPGMEGSKGCSFADAYDFTFVGGVAWAGQSHSLNYCHPDMDDWWGTHIAPGHLGLPVHQVRVLLGTDDLFLLSFVSSAHVTPGNAFRIYQLAAFRKEQEFVQVAAVDTPLRAHALDIVTGDFDGDGADEVVVAAHLGDSSTFLHLVRGTSWHLQAFAKHAGGGRLLGAGDIGGCQGSCRVR
jgi:hypothetical protein